MLSQIDGDTVRFQHNKGGNCSYLTGSTEILVT